MGKYLVVALSLALAACGTTAGHSENTAQPAPSGKWSDYSYAKEGFAVSAPTEPSLTTQTAETAAGPVEMHLYQVEVGAGMLLVVTSRLHTKDKRTAQQVIAESKQGAAAAVHGKLAAQKAIALGKYPGTEIEIAADKTHSRNRIYVVNRKIYQVMAIGPVDRALPRETDQFYQSFRLLE